MMGVEQIMLDVRVWKPDKVMKINLTRIRFREDFILLLPVWSVYGFFAPGGAHYDRTRINIRNRGGTCRVLLLGGTREGGRRMGCLDLWAEIRSAIIMSDHGWIKIDRRISEWGWYKDHSTFRLFFHLLLHANWKPSEYQGNKVGRGEIVIGINALASQVGLSVQATRTSLKKLEKSGEINKRSTNKFSIVSICTLTNV